MSQLEAKLRDAKKAAESKKILANKLRRIIGVLEGVSVACEIVKEAAGDVSSITFSAVTRVHPRQ